MSKFACNRFVLQVFQRLLAADDTIGPRDLDDCKQATRIWTGNGWVENPAKLAECNALRDRRDFDRKLEQGLENNRAQRPPAARHLTGSG